MENIGYGERMLIERYRGIPIYMNCYGWYDVPLANCFSAGSVENARRAIDRNTWLFKKLNRSSHA